MKKTGLRFLCLLVVALFAAGLLPVSALAASLNTGYSFPMGSFFPEIKGMKADRDYAADELVFQASSREEAQAYADKMNATLTSYQLGVAVVTPTKKTETKLDAAMSSAGVLQTASAGLPELEPNYIFQACDVSYGGAGSLSDLTDTYASNLWHLEDIGALDAWDAFDDAAPSSVTVAVLDTGVYASHEDLKNLTALESVATANSTVDCDGHGTHVCGIIAAAANNAKGVAGVASGVKLISIRVFTNSETAYMSDVISGINLAVKNGADVISMSLGSAGSNSTALQTAINNAVASGCTVVAAAGNEGNATAFYPAACDNVIAVAATDSADTLAYYSNYGSWVDISAPGSLIYSTYYKTSSKTGTYAYMSGTSMATPMVSASAALLYASHSGITPSEVESCLESSATGYVSKNTSGTIVNAGGIVNVYDALCALAGPSVTLPAESLTLAVGASKNLAVTVNAYGSTYVTGSLSVKSSNAAVATASLSGSTLTVTGKGSGTATVTVSADFTVGSSTVKKTATLSVSVNQYNWQQVADYYLYTATSSPATNASYVIASGTSTSVYALKGTAAGTSSSAVTVSTVTGGKKISAVGGDTIWTLDASKRFYCTVGGTAYYLQYAVSGSTYSLGVTTDAASATAWNLKTNGTGVTVYTKVTVKSGAISSTRYLYLSASSGTFKLTASTSSSTTSYKVYLYKKGSAGAYTYAALTGTTSYDITTSDSLTLSDIQKNAKVLLSATGSDSSYTTASWSDSQVSYAWNTPLNTAAAGTYVLTVSYNGTAIGTITVTVTSAKLTGITVTANPTTTAYKAFEKLGTSGMTVTAQFSNSTSQAVTDYTVSYIGNNDSFRYGNTYATVSYTKGGVTKTANVNVTVSKAEPAVNPQVGGTTIYIGDSALPAISTASGDTAGTITWDSYAMPTVTGNQTFTWTFTPTDATNYNGKTGSVAFDVKAALTDIEITNAPIDLSYAAFESLDTGGLEVTASFNDGTDSILSDSDYTIVYENDGDSFLAGEETVTISYTLGDVTKTAGISLDGAVVQATPTVTARYSGDTVYVGGKLPEITTSDGDTPGDIEWEDYELDETGEDIAFIWTFTPADDENYETVTDTAFFTVAELSYDWVSLTGSVTYARSTGPASGSPFLITNPAATGVYALTGGSSTSRTSVKLSSVTDGYEITGVTDATLWYMDDSGRIYCTVSGTNYYLCYSSGLSLTTDEASAPTWRLSNKGANLYMRNGSKYLYLNYASSRFILTSVTGMTSTYKVYLYEKTAETLSGQVSLSGNLDYTTYAGSGFGLSDIQASTFIFYREDEDSDIEELDWDDSLISWSWDEDLDTDEAGSYTLTVAYDGAVIGDVTVTVES